MPIAHIDLFPNALFNLFTLSAERYIPRDKGEKVKRWKVEKVKRWKSKKRKDANAPFLVFCSSGCPETVPAMSADFRGCPKMCQRCREIFGNARKRAGDVGRISGTPENVPTVWGDFRGRPKTILRQFGIRSNTHSAYRFISEYTFWPFHAICWEVHPPNLPRNKGERWKSERMQTLYKDKKANNAVHLPLYWNVLRLFI